VRVRGGVEEEKEEEEEEQKRWGKACLARGRRLCWMMASMAVREGSASTAGAADVDSGGSKQGELEKEKDGEVEEEQAPCKGRRYEK